MNAITYMIGSFQMLIPTAGTDGLTLLQLSKIVEIFLKAPGILTTVYVLIGPENSMGNIQYSISSWGWHETKPFMLKEDSCNYRLDL